MRQNRYAPTVDRLEPRELLTAGQPNPTDPVLPPSGPMNPIIITPVPNPTPHLPPGPVIA